MNLQRGNINSILVTGRDLSDTYTLSFVSVLTQAVKTCEVENEGSAKGPLILTFEITTNPTTADDIDLGEGDHILNVIGDTGSIWSEQVRVN
ncbi:MAG: hypothetical protein WAU08_14875 [Flavobacteriales bacterium]